jgi:hypothetical protein
MIEFVLKIILAIFAFPFIILAGAVFGAFYFSFVWIEAMTSNV